MARYGWLCAALAVLTVAVFGPVVRHDYFQIDDGIYVSRNPHVGRGLTAETVRWAFTAELTHDAANLDYWQPMTILTRLIAVECFGHSAATHHATSLVFHVLNVLLLFLSLLALARAGMPAASPGEDPAPDPPVWRCAAVAALFAIHPQRVETVAWIVDLKGVLCAFYWILTLWAYAHYVKRPSPARYLVVLCLFALALMSKPMAVTLPAILLLLDFWPLRRASPLSSFKIWGRLALEKIPLLFLAFLSTALSFRYGDLALREEGASMLVQALNAPVAYVWYLWKTIWPSNLLVMYSHAPRAAVQVWQVGFSVVALIGVTAGVLRAAVRCPYLPVGWFWFLITLVTPLLAVTNIFAHDHYTYLPHIGLYLMLAWGASDLVARKICKRQIVAGLAGTAVLAFSVASAIHLPRWQNSVTLLEYHLKHTESPLIHDSLGNAWAERKDFEKAKSHYLRALRINPFFAGSHAGLANVLLNAGETDEAIVHYRAALRLNPGLLESRNNLGAVLSVQGGLLDEAIENLSETLRADPDNANAHYNMGTAKSKKGDIESSIRHYMEAIRLKPDYQKAHYNLGLAMSRQGKTEEAIQHYTEALKLDPKDAAAENNLGVSLTELGRMADAQDHFVRALAINPANLEAHCNMSLILAGQGKIEESERHLIEALSMDSTHTRATKLLEKLRHRVDQTPGD